MGFLFSRKSKKPIIKHESFDFDDEEEKNESLGLKIHICGDNERKKDIMDNLFSTKISDKKYKNRGTNEFKTEQFFWIVKTYNEFTNNTINAIMEDIKNDRDKIKEEEVITQQIILCFISEQNKNILTTFNVINEDIYAPLIIIVSQTQIEPFGKIDKRRITNIVYENMSLKILNSRIISILWNCDCYYNEKGNKICRYSPDNIFKSLNVNLSFHTINILLTGLSRSGKSTFINYISNKLMALETPDKVSVTKKITEYYIYSNVEDKTDQIAIKLIDTPGIVPNQLNETIKTLKDYLNNEENNMEKRIHFVLFFFNEGNSLEGTDDVLKMLNNCNIPVLFAINKAFDESDNEKTKDINSTISFFTQKNLTNLINKDNYFGINIVGNKKVRCFGVDELFKRLYIIYKEKNKFSDETKKKINNFIKEYHMENLNPENIKDGVLSKTDDIKKELEKKVNMFKYLNIDSIIKSGIKPANRCKKVINSLRNISNKLSDFDDFPAISLFQAFMVKEIGEIFGYDTNMMNYGIKLYLMKIESFFKSEDFSLRPGKTDELINTINLSTEIIEKQIKSEFEKSNKEFILILARIFKTIKENCNIDNESEDQFNVRLTNEICFYCMNYLEEQLRKTNGIIFWNHYYNICQKFLNIFEYYSKINTDKWVKKEMIIIKE